MNEMIIALPLGTIKLSMFFFFFLQLEATDLKVLCQSDTSDL